MNPPITSLLRKRSETHWPDNTNMVQPPEYLCKYRTLNDYNKKDTPLLKYTSDIITECSIWHGSPKDFNDPFDCHISVDTDNTKEEIRAYVDEAWADRVKSERKRVADELIRDRAKFRRLINISVRKSVDEIPICCYGEEADNILMWSHYGDSHKGVCFKFKTATDPGFFKDIFKINYASKYPHFNLLRDKGQLVEQVLARKSQVWSYEKEWRVFQRKKIGSYRFVKNALSEIVFGCLASSDKIDEVIKLVDADPELDHIVFKQARLSKTNFALLLKDIPRKKV